MATKQIQYEELRHFGPENFCAMVDTPSTKQASKTTTDQFDRQTEQTVFYRGSKILGMQTRSVCGYRYYIRKG